MARHQDPRQEAAPAAPPGDDQGTGARPRTGRGGNAARLLVAILTAVLAAWAGLAVTAAVSTTASSAARNTPGPVAAEPTASPVPSPTGSPAGEPGLPSPSGATASPAPIPTPTPVPPVPVGEPPARSQVRAIAVRAQLQVELDRIRKRLAIPGVSATIIFRDGTAWTGTSGLADVGRKVDVAPGTAFAVGSVSKTYTAALILALAGDGKIKLDAPAATYLSGLKLDRRITVRMLLNHTSGLDDFFLHPPIDTALQKNPSAAWSVKRTLRYVAKPYFPPGKGWHYSNTNYLYLGLIAEHVTGSPLGVALHDRFFGPLGLDGTWYQAAEDPRAPTAHGYRFVGSSRSAAPIDLSDGTPIVPFTSVVTASGGAGSIAATSSDAARWARLLYTGDVLGPQMTAEMLSGVAGTAGYSPRVPYGLGVQAFPIDGRPTVGHSGRLLGFRASIRHVTGEATTIAVLTNQSRADPSVIVEHLLSIVFAPAPPCFRCQTPT